MYAATYVGSGRRLQRGPQGKKPEQQTAPGTPEDPFKGRSVALPTAAVRRHTEVPLPSGTCQRVLWVIEAFGVKQPPDGSL